MKDLNYEMNSLFENEKRYKIEEIAKIAFDNMHLWVERVAFNHLKNEVEKIQDEKQPMENAMDLMYDFFMKYIDPFFVMLNKSTGVEIAFLEEHKDEIVADLVAQYIPKPKYPNEPGKTFIGSKEDPEEDPILAKALKQSRETEKKSRVKDYHEMSQYELKKAVDKALDADDFETLEKIRPYLREGFVKAHVEEVLNEEEQHHITKSYDHVLTRDEIKQLIGKILVKYQQQRKYENITSMLTWLKKNNFGDYQHNKWIRAIVDTLFKKSAGTWIPINTNLTLEQLTDKVMNFWKTKLTKEGLEIDHLLNNPFKDEEDEIKKEENERNKKFYPKNTFDEDEDSLDEQCTMNSIFEGCNCGGNKKIKLGFLSRRPKPTKIKK